ncbi:BCL-6 corepressor-like protein 1 [Drosophila bipectinata]|uniref:BCL-6 corepressor-like protein 1 n=1 Tax=Drosophila bipectinata TaxID=42026 RepID=UPI001C8966F7|nr:proline-rich receptor-like protein kinase PERK10 [Drosophila bipectinata]
MFCSDSCELGCKVPSGANGIACGNGPQGAAGGPQASQQQQINMCYAPLPMQSNTEMCARCEQAEPPRVGLCLVTEGPEGLSIDCNVPLPNSFNLDEYKKQMVYSCCQPTNMSPYCDTYGFPQAAISGTFAGMAPIQSLNPISSPNTITSPGCSFHCQSCPLGGPCPGYDSLPMHSHPSQGAVPLPKSAGIPRHEQAMTPAPAMMPQIFCLPAPNNSNANTTSCLASMEASNGLQQSDQQPMYFCGMVPAQAWNLQAINLVPVMPVPQQQQPLITNPGQDLQQQQQAPQLLRLPCDLSFSRLLTELRRERDRSCCDSCATSSSQPLALQLFAPTHTVTFCDPPATTMCAASPTKREASTSATPVPPPTDPPAPRSPPPTAPPAATSSTMPPESTTAPAAAAPSRARSVSPKRSRSCLRNKDLWGGSGTAQSHPDYPSSAQNHPAYPSSAQHGAGNVCMKCGNCWHCPRCNCPSCSWHPGLLRPPSRESRYRQFPDR